MTVEINIYKARGPIRDSLGEIYGYLFEKSILKLEIIWNNNLEKQFIPHTFFPAIPDDTIIYEHDTLPTSEETDIATILSTTLAIEATQFVSSAKDVSEELVEVS